MVIAHHLIWTAYGWWLPNDPRGSSSRTIRYIERNPTKLCLPPQRWGFVTAYDG